jgi:phosphatidylglycerol lysyltransferase
MIHLFSKTQSHSDTETSENGRTRARHLLKRWGGAPLLFFGLLPDKRYLFGNAEEEGEWAVAYRVLGRHALALGDPLGDPETAPSAVAGFLAHCRRHRWTPAFYQVTPTHLGTYRAAGLNAVKVGEDAQIALSEFSLAGKRFKNLRNDLRRVEKSGVLLETYGPERPPTAAVTADMAAISEGWRKAHRAGEGSFAMGGFDPQSTLFRESRYFVARNSESGQMLAFTTFVPVYGQGQTNGGWALDLMRRRADALHGVMDFLIISAAEAFAAEGASLLSLGLSPLAGEDDPAEAGAASHVRRFLFTRLNRVYNFQGLHTFKGKFATQWEPRYLIYKRGIGLTATAGAILKAHLTTNEPPKLPTGRVGRSSRRQALALATLLLLVFTPFEKTLAKRASVLPHRVAQTWGHHSPHWHSGGWNTPHWRHMLPTMHHFRRV